MRCNTGQNKNSYQQKTIEQVNNLSYLDCDVTYNYSNNIEQKSNKFTSISGTISRNFKNETRKEAHKKFYKTIAVPIRERKDDYKQIRSIQSQEMRFLRRVKECSRLDRNKNDDIRRILNIYISNGKVKDQRIKCKKNLQRIEEEIAFKDV